MPRRPNRPREADIKYLQDSEIKKNDWLHYHLKERVQMSQLDIPPISNLHSLTIEEKVGNEEMNKIDQVTPSRIGLRG